MEIRAHRRQFVIANRPVLVGPDWRSVALEDGYHLSYQLELSVQHVQSAGRKLIVLGQSFHMPGAERGGDLALGRAGRFVSIDWPYLYSDAGALFPTYYTQQAGRDVLVTSSVALAAQLTGSEVSPRSLRWGGLNWVVSPGSTVAGVRKLVREQRLRVPSGSVEFIDRAIRPIGSFHQAKDQLAADLVAIASQIRETPGTVYLALTAGLDSRTLLGALVAADVKFECVTQSFQGVNRTDIDLAARICRYLGVKHRIVGPEPFDEHRLQVWREHTLESHHDADDAYLIPQNQYRFLKSGDVLVRGGCFELGRRFYGQLLEGLDLQSATGADLWSRFEGERGEMHQIEGLNDWLRFRRQHDNGLDLADAFYLDQRVGGWLSAIEHGLDLNPGISIPPANADRIFAALISPSESERRDGLLQRAVIEHLAPNLLRFPVNPKTLEERTRTLVGRGKGILKRLMRRLPTPAVRNS
jgi:hypothetical protein